MPITHVSDTARWVAIYRAQESERPDALFHDPFARRLAGERGEAITAHMERGMQASWPMVVRTAVMDEIILRHVAEGVDTVLNLAAGLDARPWRLALPASLHWIDADLPDILGHKTATLAGDATACRYEAVPIDLADPAARQALFARVGAVSQNVLVIAEGLLIYLGDDDVAGLAADLHAIPSFRAWLIDIASPGLVKMMAKSWGKTVAAGNAPFRFAPAESTAWFAPHGWMEAEFRSTFYEGIRLNRTFRFARFFAFLGRFAGTRRQEENRRFSGIALLERRD